MLYYIRHVVKSLIVILEVASLIIQFFVLVTSTNFDCVLYKNNPNYDPLDILNHHS
jgi:hypothetical protein